MNEQSRLLSSANDPRLSALFEAADDAERAAAIEAILVLAKPMIRRVLSHARTSALRPEDLDDVASTVDLRLFQRLQLACLYEERAIRGLDEFVATLTYNCTYDLLRRRYPERTRLKTRLRYLFTHDRRLGLWQREEGLLCWPAGWQERPAAGPRVVVTKDNASAVMIRRDAPGDALLAVFARTGRPLPFEDVVEIAATLWDISDVERPIREELIDQQAGPLERVEARQYLSALWREIQELRAPQRAALLMNLRDDDGHSALPHLVATGIATFEEIAAALEMPPSQLWKLWNDFPIGDAVIGELLYLTRQQVINLRKAARERLARRLK
jgi:hypothetical protein